jgi:hypothetical protein
MASVYKDNVNRYAVSNSEIRLDHIQQYVTKSQGALFRSPSSDIVDCYFCDISQRTYKINER